MIANAFAGNPSVINYDMFVAIFGLLSLFYLLATSFVESLIFHPLLVVALDVINALLYLIAGLATAVQLGAHRCSNAVSAVAPLFPRPASC